MQQLCWNYLQWWSLKTCESPSWRFQVSS